MINIEWGQIDPNDNRLITTVHDALYLLSLVPHSDVTQILLWTGGEVKLEGESEHMVNTAEEVQTALHL